MHFTWVSSRWCPGGNARIVLYNQIKHDSVRIETISLRPPSFKGEDIILLELVNDRRYQEGLGRDALDERAQTSHRFIRRQPPLRIITRHAIEQGLDGLESRLQ